MPITPGETSRRSAGLLEQGAIAFATSVPEHPADDGLFGPRSVTWRLTGSITTPVIAIRALLLQALHPLAMAGVDQHSSWRTDPGRRLASTSAYEVTVSVGDTAAATAAAARVRQIHSFVKGTDPATGRPYAASDPALLLWVHNALVDSTLACSRLYGSTSADDGDRYVREQLAAAEIIGIPAGLAPRTAAELEAYFEAIRPELLCTPAAATATSYLLDYVESARFGEDDDAESAQLGQDITDAAIAALPDWAIGLYAEKVPAIAEARDRLGEMPASAQLAVRQTLGVLDAVFLGEPGVLEARQRLQRRMRAAQ
ncbi:MAG TPA: oxygenase MpaB family protein [Trebonia sp.]|nr:oxygenase MpaB family protein [Trebonia sp.]